MFILSICLFYIKTLIICKRRIRCGFYTLIFVETNNLVMFIFNNHKHVSRICFLYLLGKNVDKCQEVVILMEIYGTFCNLLCKLSRKKSQELIEFYPFTLYVSYLT